MLNEIYYSKADNFDTVLLPIALEFWNQWEYTTKNGETVLVLWHQEGGGTPFVLFNREDAFIWVRIQAYYQPNDVEIYMNVEQLEQVIDQLDLSMQVGKVDMALAREKLAKFK